VTSVGKIEKSWPARIDARRPQVFGFEGKKFSECTKMIIAFVFMNSSGLELLT
jgi:hypothetical protein